MVKILTQISNFSSDLVKLLPTMLLCDCAAIISWKLARLQEMVACCSRVDCAAWTEMGPYGFGCMDHSNSFPCQEPNAPGGQRRDLFRRTTDVCTRRSFLWCHSLGVCTFFTASGWSFWVVFCTPQAFQQEKNSWRQNGCKTLRVCYLTLGFKTSPPPAVAKLLLPSATVCQCMLRILLLLHLGCHSLETRA